MARCQGIATEMSHFFFFFFFLYSIYLHIPLEQYIQYERVFLFNDYTKNNDDYYIVLDR